MIFYDHNCEAKEFNWQRLASSIFFFTDQAAFQLISHP
jgi:hypothetical protein